MTRLIDPNNYTVAIKISRQSRNALKQLADAEHTTPSTYLRKTLNDRINFERSINNQALLEDDSLPHDQKPEEETSDNSIVSESGGEKTQAAEIAPTAEIVRQGRDISNPPHDPQTTDQ